MLHHIYLLLHFSSSLKHHTFPPFPSSIDSLTIQITDNHLLVMSGTARRRGRGANPNDNVSDNSSRPSGTPAAPRGGFDGPAPRGSASGPGSTGRGRGSKPPPAAGSVPVSQPTSPPISQQASGAMTTSQPTSEPGGRASAPPAPQGPVTGDPARERQDYYTDQFRNVDLPPSFYNFDERVRDLCLLAH